MENFENFEGTGLWESHEYATHDCPHCGATQCHSCCGFDSRGDHAHNQNQPFMTCRNCGRDFDI